MDLRATSPAAPILVVQHVLPRYVCISPTHRIGVFLAPAAFIVPKLASVLGALGVFALLFGAIWASTATFRATKLAAKASLAATIALAALDLNEVSRISLAPLIAAATRDAASSRAAWKLLSRSGMRARARREPRAIACAGPS